MRIIFTKLTYQNFKSVGNIPITIELNKHKTTLLAGANGAGKSIFLSALCFALFGRGYGPITKPALINSINQKNLLTTLEFSIAKKIYKIIRGIKPNIFEIYEDGVLINQDPTIRDYQKILEQSILKFNYRTFAQIVAVGGGDYVPFMKLTAKDRREFVEDLLDIRIFSTMNLLVKEEFKTGKEKLRELESELNAIKEKTSMQKAFIQTMRGDKNVAINKILTLIETTQVLNEDLSKTCNATMESLAKHESLMNKHTDLDDSLTEIRLKSKQLQNYISEKNGQSEIYEDMNSCPTCFQTINQTHKENIVMGIKNETDALIEGMAKLAEEEDKLRLLMAEYSDSIEAYAATQKMIEELNQKIFGNNILINSSNKQLTELENDTTSIEEEREKLKILAKSYITTDKSKRECLVNQQYREFLQDILSDSGIKSKIIKQYLPTMNALINSKLNDLELFLSMKLDENFNESFKSRHRDTFMYEHFSDGQKRRIDIAIMLAWVEIAKAKNAVSTNIFILDEMDAPMDSSGSDMLHSLLKSCSSENIFIISHKSDLLADKVDHVIGFRLHNNFTEIDNI